MILTLNRKVFLFFLPVFQVVLLLFFNTPFELIFLSFFVLFMWWGLAVFQLRLQAQFIHYPLLIATMVAVFSAFKTHSIPLTIVEMTALFVCLLAFIFFSALFSESKKTGVFFAQTFILGSFALSLYFIFFTAFPGLSAFLPEFNLFTVETGHSHFAPLLLLVIPLVWWFHYSQYSSTFTLKGTPLLYFFYSAVLVTASRWAVVISLIFFPLLITYDWKKLHLLRLVAPTAVLLLVVGFTFIVSSEKCYEIESVRSLCKPITREVRPYYYRQSVQVIRDYPLFGYGPGTSGLVSKKYSVVPHHVSRYTHNFILQVFSEYGVVVGFLFLLFLCLVLRKIYDVVFVGKKKNLQYFVALSTLALIANSLVDFDLNLSYYLLFFFVFVALLYSREPLNKLETITINSVWKIIASIILITGVLATTALVLFSFGSSFRSNLLVLFFTFPHKDLIESAKSNPEVLLKLENLYQYDSNFLYTLLQEYNSDSEESVRIYGKLEQLSRYVYLDYNYHQLLLQTGKYEQLAAVSTETLNFLELQKEQGLSSGFDRKKKLQDYLRPVAEYYLEQENIPKAVSYYRKVLDLEPWFFHLTFPEFLYSDRVSIGAVGEVLKQLEIEPSTFGKHEKTVMTWLTERVATSSASVAVSELVPFFSFYSDLEVWHQMSVKMYPLARAGNPLYYNRWYELWVVVMQHSKDRSALNTEYQYKLMNTLFEYGEVEKAKVVQDYLYRGVLVLPATK